MSIDSGDSLNLWNEIDSICLSNMMWSNSKNAIEIDVPIATMMSYFGLS